MTLVNVINRLKQLHQYAVNNSQIRKPISWALYQTWKWANNIEEERGDDNAKT